MLTHIISVVERGKSTMVSGTDEAIVVVVRKILVGLVILAMAQAKLN